MQDDRAVPRHVVEAFLEAFQAERVAVVAVVGVGGDEEAEARFETAGAVGKSGGDVVAAVLAVRDELTEEDPLCGEVEYEQPRLRRGDRVVDHGQEVAPLHEPLVFRLLRGVHREAQHVRREPRRLLEQRREVLGSTSIARGDEKQHESNGRGDSLHMVELRLRTMLAK